MICEKCGTINPEEQEYCVTCGEKLTEVVTNAIETETNEIETNEIEEADINSEIIPQVKAQQGGPSKGKNGKLLIGGIAIGILLIVVLIAVYFNKNAATDNKPEATQEATATPAQDTNTATGTRKVVVTLDKEAIVEPVFRLYFWITQQRFESADPNIWTVESDGKKTIDIAKENTVQDIKLGIAAKEKAQELGIKFTAEEEKSISDQADEIMTGNVELATKLKFEKKDMEEFIGHGLYVQKVIAKIGEGYTPTEAEIKAQTEQVTAQYQTATVKHVLITGKEAKGKALAEEVLKKALAGEDMATLAKTYSQDPGSKDKGGEYTFPKGQMVPEFENAAFTGEIGKVYPTLVETDYGYHIIKVEKREAGDAAQIKKDSEQAAKTKYAQDELTKFSETITVKTTDVYDAISIIK